MSYENLRDIEKTIGGKIRYYRMLKGLPQTQIAELLGVSFQQLQKYESGANRISPGKLFLLSKHLNIPIDSFFEFGASGKHDLNEVVLAKDDIKILELFKSLKNPHLKKKALEFCSILNELDSQK